MAFKNNTQLIGICFNSIKTETYNAVKYVRRACIIYSNFFFLFFCFPFISSRFVLDPIQQRSLFAGLSRGAEVCRGWQRPLRILFIQQQHTYTRKYICIILHVGFRRRSVSPVDVILSRRRTSNKYVVDRAVEAYTCKV